MAAKRALVVDDSKSARTFLAKMLEKYELEVVSVESAEQAIEYLAHHRPDVIFMDHLMPGMDGLQAVQAIKNNPRTATIPIMMYTSQEGELYLGQARALGAVGVLPKQIKPADVSKVLYQLHLLPDRRSADQGAFRQADAGVEIIEDGATTSPVARPATELGIREQLAELRRAITVALDGHSERLRADLHAAMREAIISREESGTARTRRTAWGWIAVLAIIAVASLVAAGEQAARSRVLAGQLAELRAALPSLAPGSAPAQGGASGLRGPGAPSGANGQRGGMVGGGPEASGTSSSGAAPESAARGAHADGASADQSGASAAAARPLVEVVPFGEDPLGGPRLESMRQLFSRLIAQGFRGMIEVRVFPGRFCLTGDATDGFSPASDSTPYARCDLVGPSQPDSDAPAPQRVPVAFADLTGELHTASHGEIDVQVLAGDEKSTLVAYPPVSDSLTAGEWNRAAAANNRIEIRLR